MYKERVIKTKIVNLWKRKRMNKEAEGNTLKIVVKRF